MSAPARVTTSPLPPPLSPPPPPAATTTASAPSAVPQLVAPSTSKADSTRGTAADPVPLSVSTTTDTKADPDGDDDLPALLYEDPVLQEKKMKKYEIKLKDLQWKYAELCALTESMATAYRAELESVEKLQREVTFLQQRKKCWEVIYPSSADKPESIRPRTLKKHSNPLTESSNKRKQNSSRRRTSSSGPKAKRSRKT